ncbi:hypothetical protein [Azospirillum sp. sgz302134]
MSVQTFNPTDLPQSTANWAVAQRIVGPFAPHAQVSPDLTIMLDPGYLLNGTTLTEVKAQVVGPFAPPASGFRIDRVVVDRSTGAASVVAGTANSLTPPAIPAGKLPVARVFVESTAQAIDNNSIVDERALFDMTPDSTPVISRATLGDVDQTGIPSQTNTKINLGTAEINVGSGFDTASKRFKPSVSGHYSISAQICLLTASNTDMRAILYKNGSTTATGGESTSTGAVGFATVTDIIYLNGSTDYVELYASQSTGNSLTASGGRNATYLVASRIG